MNPNKSPGPDVALPRVLNELQEIIAESLYLIFRQSLDLGENTSWLEDGASVPHFEER